MPYTLVSNGLMGSVINLLSFCGYESAQIYFATLYHGDNAD